MANRDFTGTTGNDEHSSRYRVRGWFFEDESKKENCINGPRISSYYPSRKKAMVHAEAIARHYPKARLTLVDALYSPGGEDAERRAEFLAEMDLPEEAEFIDGEMHVPDDYRRTDYRLCTAEDCPCVMNAPCYYWQGGDEPLHIVIRADATERDLRYMAERFHLSVENLVAFHATL